MTTELTVLGRQCVLSERLGRGAAGDVWVARSATGEPSETFEWVLKLAHDEGGYEWIASEAERLLCVDSPHCVRLLHAFTLSENVEAHAGGEETRFAAGTPCLVFERSAGVALDPVRGGADRVQRLLQVARDVARGLADLHATGMAHGDIKPANILVSESQVDIAGNSRDSDLFATLVDFGLSGSLREETARGGTRRYLAPECFSGERAGDARFRDLYALGVTLAELASPEVAADASPERAFLGQHLPHEVKRLVAALLSGVPAARPSAEWVWGRALALLGETESPEACHARRVSAIRRTYLTVRRAQLSLAASAAGSQIESEGVVGQWLRDALGLFRSVAALRRRDAISKPIALADLDAVGRARWLVELCGVTAAAWPELPVSSDAELAQRLLDLASEHDPSRVTFAELDAGARAAPSIASDWASSSSGVVRIALAMGRGPCSRAMLDAAEQLLARDGDALPEAHAELGLALGRSLRLRGELGRALCVLDRVATPAARLEIAEVRRRAGDALGASACIRELCSIDLPGDLAAKAQAICARLQLDTGDAAGALALLDENTGAAAASVASLEVRALALLGLGQKAAAHEAATRARLLAEGDEERARVEAVFGNLHHFEGQFDLALQAFRAASEHAARAGAALEEASYLTGVSAAAAQVGELGLAGSCARRALLLFQGLRRPREAARAQLSLASTLASVGARLEAGEQARECADRAEASGDVRCQAYAHLVWCDVAEDPSKAAECAHTARGLLEPTLGQGDGDDTLRVSARLHEYARVTDVAGIDSAAERPSAALDAVLEWWAARARVAEARTSRELGADTARILRALLGAVGRAAPSTVRGPAFAAGAALAARLKDADAARRLSAAAADAARELLRRAGPDFEAQVRALPWVRMADLVQTSPFSPEQLTDVERLVRALGQRDRLRPLLEQVVDALVLWTGVERGLLLLRAPGGKLRPRAARNLFKADLVGPQLELSHSLSERALALGEPVVAVDATGDLPLVHESVHALKLRSVLAVPLIARGQALGVVYLDDRMRRGAFGARELSWVRLVATLAALAIADARDQILLRRAARRATRAESRLREELSRREAELDVAVRELSRSRGARDTRFPYADIVGDSESVRRMLRLVDRVACSDVPVLIQGESGSGKELVARAIHRHGQRQERPFVVENCGAIPEPLLESALFGHVRGAFTGADRARAGLFEVAHGGTLLLDEIGEMSLGMQAKLLRVLQDGEVKAVGSDKARRVDVRVIGATHRDLEALVAAGKFREDLYYRLNVISIRVPPLRERVGDIPILVKHFVARHAGERRVQVSRPALERFCAYPWPGNVRQLENEIRRVLVLADEVVGEEHLSPELVQKTQGKAIDELNLRQRIDALEAELVRVALRRTEGNQTRAAELLGVSRFGLQKMMKRLEISSVSRA
ncbi:MAG TPA: sigma 54-interacting transcriptional regulator [Polyangiaceae bacterium]|nr:sigma 54-interacting transcriptional regulator [Polyangiaceae bacterium]